MMKKLLILLLAGLVWSGHAQLNLNRVKKWYFGSSAGLDFTTTPPSTITANLSTTEGSSCISDNQANTLFYASGWQVKNKSNLFMANGTGLLGHSSSSQAVLIVPWPGSDSLYYVFTTDAVGGPNGFMYSLVDMSLAVGLGSVTVKNAPIQSPSCEKLVATLHCNGHDVWVLTHDYGNNNFRALLVTNAGITSTVISSVGPIISSSTTTQGQMKFSPTGKKLSLATIGLGFDLYDFDNSTGMVSNYLSIGTNTLASGVEFSPDSRYMYGSTWGVGTKSLVQWDLCAGSASAISASAYSLGPLTNGNAVGPLQLGPDGRIYNSASATYSMNIISNPNAQGALCGYLDGGISTQPGGANFSIPNFVSNYFRQQASAFTYTANCQQVSFTGMSAGAYAAATCSATGSPLLYSNWDFGDPASSTNTANAVNPTHYYSGAGTFTVQLVMGYSCRNDTLRQVISIPALSPAITFSTHAAICKGEATTITVNSTGPVTWLPAGTGSGTLVTVSPTTTTVYTVTATNASNCTTSKTLSLVVNKCLGVGENPEEGNVLVYPNPGNETLFIESPQSNEVIITDYLGRVLIRKETAEGKSAIDITSLAAGGYIIQLNHGIQKRQFEFIKID
jgi:hypothetical protein